MILHPDAKSKVDNNLKGHFTNIILLNINHCLATQNYLPSLRKANGKRQMMRNHGHVVISAVCRKRESNLSIIVLLIISPRFTSQNQIF